MRKLTYFIATSLDGFVSRENGDISDFTFEGEHVKDVLDHFPETIPTHLRSRIEVVDENRRFDTVLMGRQTYEVGLKYDVVSPYQHLSQFVFSTTITASPSSDITLVQKNSLDLVRELKRNDGLEIWLCGGPSLASELITEIDSVVLKVNPFIMGNGKSLFATPLTKRPLKLANRKDYSNGFSLVEFDFADALSQDR